MRFLITRISPAQTVFESNERIPERQRPPTDNT